MAEVLLFHHAQGLTEGVHAFADALRAGGHVVHVPDLYDGRTFATLDEGVAYMRSLPGDLLLDRGRAAAEGLPEGLVYAGMSMGLLPAQLLAQTRPGARGALLLHGIVPPEEFGAWPAGVPAQVHTMAGDDWGDADVAQEVAGRLDELELFLYDGDRHLFTDRSLADHDEAAAALVLERVLALLQRVDAG